MKYIFAAMLGFIFICFSFAGSCPAGANDCFLCGGTNGIPCAQTDACLGHHDEKTGLNIACACPQGKPCACYCPYADYGAVHPSKPGASGGSTLNTSSSKPNTSVSKPSGVQSDDKCAGCVYGCSADGSVCISAKAEDIGAPNGPVEISAYSGEVLVSNDGGSTWARAAPGMRVDFNYMVKSGANSRATLEANDGSKVFMDPDTALNMKELEPRSATTLDVIIVLVKGALFSDVTKREGTKFELETGVSVAGVQGTQFYVSYDPVSRTSVTKVYKGNVSVESSSGTVTLSPAQEVATTATGNGAVASFNPSEDKTPFAGAGGAGACCGSGALIMMSAAIIGIKTRYKK